MYIQLKYLQRKKKLYLKNQFLTLMEGSFSNYRKNRRIPLKRKLEVIEYSNIRGNNTAAASRESV